jgi:hypothetical protein
MPFLLETLGCDIHSSLDVIKSFRRIKDCEENSPIVTTGPRDELTVFEKLKFRPRFAISEILWSNFANSENFAIGEFL